MSLIAPLFFFQAEDGIRDYKVTGVQTCDLPISPSRAPRRPPPAVAASANGPPSAETPARLADGSGRDRSLLPGLHTSFLSAAPSRQCCATCAPSTAALAPVDRPSSRPRVAPSNHR